MHKALFHTVNVHRALQLSRAGAMRICPEISAHGQAQAQGQVGSQRPAAAAQAGPGIRSSKTSRRHTCATPSCFPRRGRLEIDLFEPMATVAIPMHPAVRPMVPPVMSSIEGSPTAFMQHCLNAAGICSQRSVGARRTLVGSCSPAGTGASAEKSRMRRR